MRKVEDDDAKARQRTSAQAGEGSAVSYLVRFWLEPREQQGESAAYRGYARDLRTGEERYFADPRRLAEHILRRLHAARQEETARSEADEVEDAFG